MALRDQPYLPLFIQDFLTDEKLNECSASATGIYIKIMCLMHKQDNYGKILLKQKDKQNESKEKCFALKFAKLLTFDVDTIESALFELLGEKVLQIEGDFLVQKRMVADNELSLKRSNSGEKGGLNTQKNKKYFAKAKNEANTEYEYDINSDDIKDLEGIEDYILSSPEPKKVFLPVYAKMMKIFESSFSEYFVDVKIDFPACELIAQKTEKLKKWPSGGVLNGHLDDFIAFWTEIVEYVAADNWLRTRSLNDLSTKEWQRLGQHMNKKELQPKTKKVKSEDTMSDYQREIEEKREQARNRKPE